MFGSLLVGAGAALFAAAEPAPAHAPTVPVPAAATDEMSRWLETFPRPARLRFGSAAFDDYPASAVRSGVEGDVVFRYIIGLDGRVASCEIVRSSGHAVLDSATCSLAQRRLRFLPAYDADRNPIPEVRTDTVRWRLSGVGSPPPVLPAPNYHRSPALAPGAFDRALERHLAEAAPGPARRFYGYVTADDYPLSAMRAGAQGNVEMRYTIGAHGRVGDCTISRSSGNAALDSASCALATGRFLFLPAIGPDGRAMAETKTQTIAWRLPDGALQPPPESGPPPAEASQRVTAPPPREAPPPPRA